MSCNPSYDTEYLPINAGTCGQPCRNCKFDAVVSMSCNEDSCSFSWTVSRTSCANQPDDDFTGNATLDVGESRQVDFYCDSAESCARYRLTMHCTADATAPLPQE